MKKLVVTLLFSAASVFCCFSAETPEEEERCVILAEDGVAKALRNRVLRFTRESPEYRTVLTSIPGKEKPVLAFSATEFPSKEYDSVVLALHGTAIIASRVNSEENLTTAEGRDMLAGKYTVWKGAKVPLKTIYVVRGVIPVPKTGSKGPRVVMLENGRTAGGLLADEPASVVLVPFTRMDQCGAGTRIIPVNGVSPEPDNVFSGKYPLVRFYRLSCRKDAPAGIRKIYDEMRSKEFAGVLLRLDMMPVSEKNERKKQ